jgi:hypothetical protein
LPTFWVIATRLFVPEKEEDVTWINFLAPL